VGCRRYISIHYTNIVANINHRSVRMIICKTVCIDWGGGGRWFKCRAHTCVCGRQTYANDHSFFEDFLCPPRHAFNCRSDVSCGIWESMENLLQYQLIQRRSQCHKHEEIRRSSSNEGIKVEPKLNLWIRRYIKLWLMSAYSYCHQTEKGFIDCGSLCLEWSPLWPPFLAAGPFEFLL